MQTGPAAVERAFDVGLFPAIMRLFNTNPKRVPHDVVLILSKMVAIDPSIRDDLVRAGVDEFFAAYVLSLIHI